jgi:prophage antirepressor-like protein
MEFSFNDGQICLNESATNIRMVVDIEDEPWFEARPLALFLGYANAKQAIQLNIDG